MLGVPSFLKFGEKSRRLPVLGVVRAVLVGLLVLTVTLGTCFHEAKAHLGESLVAFGDQLSAWSGGKLDSKVGRLSVNGLLINRVTASTPLGIAEALERLETVCHNRGGVEVPEALLKARVPGAERSLLRGTYRRVGETQGVLACIDTGRPLGVPELARRLEQFAKTGDLSTVGQLRYVLARREGSVTSLLVLWTDGNVPLLKMFPQSGDAPGRDLPDVPRPKGSERLLSANDQASPYAITIYRSRVGSPAPIQDWYTKTLRDQGWRVISAKVGSLVARRGTRALVIRATKVAAGSTTTSIVELS